MFPSYCPSFPGSPESDPSFEPASHVVPTLRAALAQLRARTGRRVRGIEPEAARAEYLSHATDDADRLRRAADWDRAQDAARSLPPEL